MGNQRWIISLTVFAAALAASSAATAGTVQVIYSFAGGNDGEYTDTDLVIDGAGNLYGTSVQGGQYTSGTVFRLSPSAAGWIHTVLYSFTGGPDGGEPYKGVTLDSHGNLYGTAGVGGKYVGPCVDTGCGVVFKLSQTNGNWKLTVIHSFTGGKDGYGPGAGVTIDAHGNVYGMTPTGGAHGFGIVYQLTPGAHGWTERIIHAFTGGVDGLGGSAGRPLLDAAGNLYGIATGGGAHSAGCIFELTPTATGAWKSTTLYSFPGEPDAASPYGSFVADAKGNLYGTAYYGGANGHGAIYRLSRATTGWTETWLYSFQGGADGGAPISTLAADAAGNLYGTTSQGGASCNCGTIFQVTPGAQPAYSVVYRFPGSPGAGFAYNGLVPDLTGATLYGATVHGGNTNDGTIYQLTP